MQSKLLSTMLFMLLLVISASSQTYAQETEKPNETRCALDMWSITYTPISYLGITDAPAKIQSQTFLLNYLFLKVPHKSFCTKIYTERRAFLPVAIPACQ